MTLNARFLETIRQYGMLRAGDAVVAGVSGGADSMALLCLLLDERETLGLSAVEICHLHHGVRGADADRDLAFVQDFCEKRGIPFHARRADVPALSRAWSVSVEEAGRRARYGFFDETADALAVRLGLSPERVRIATAHTSGDNAETVLLNLIRGCSLPGLSGIPPVRGRIVRPLIGCARPELEAYLAARGVSFVQDETNDADEYRRNRIRHGVLPLLRAENPAVEDALLRMTSVLRAEDGFLAGQTDELLRSARRSVRPPQYDRRTLAGAHEALLRRAAAALLAESGASVDSRKTLALADAILRGAGAVPVAPGVCWRVRPGCVFLERTEQPPEPVVFSPGRTYCFGGGRVFAEPLNGFEAITKKIHENSLKNTIDCDKIKGNLILRPRAPGDAIRLYGRGCEKRLKKLFSEAGLVGRDTIPVLADDAGPVWVGGFGAAERVVCGSKTDKGLFMQYYQVGVRQSRTLPGRNAPGAQSDK